MANPSSSHHRDRTDRTDRERERERHHHHRTVSSTTLLLALSLILAVLAVMLSLPSNRAARSPPVASTDENAATEGNLWDYLSPRRSQALVQREHAIAVREAEVAKREAELLAGSIGGIAQKTNAKVTMTPMATETVIKEVFREIETIGASKPPMEIRLEDVMGREERVSEREKEVGHREETVGKRETDASRRENWIMEQLIALGNDPAPVTIETEEYLYDGPRRSKLQSLPKVVVSAPTHTETLTQTVTRAEGTETVTLEPAHTRLAAQPAPEEFVRSGKFTAPSSATTAVEVTLDELVEEDDVQPSTVERTVTVMERPRATRRVVPRRSFWNW